MPNLSRRTLFGMAAAAPIALPAMVEAAARPSLPVTAQIEDMVFTIGRLKSCHFTMYNNLRALTIRDLDFSVTGTFTAYFENQQDLQSLFDV